MAGLNLTLSGFPLLDRRMELLEELGGLPSGIIAVRNDEWLYMLEEETRHSLAIEGYFATEKELKAMIAGGQHTGSEMLGYYRTASSLYDLALQYQREKDFRIDIPLIRHIHSELFREVNGPERGRFRRGPVLIQGAKVKPPANDLPSYVSSLVRIIREKRSSCRLVPFLARIHVLFEAIHPFEDGNGRAGRILLNYLGISSGYPPLVIKGISENERQTYYRALEAGDRGFHDTFPRPVVTELTAALEKGDFRPLEMIIAQALSQRIDRIIAAVVEKEQGLVPLSELAPHFGVKPPTLRKWIERDKLIAVKRNGKLCSHPSLYLG